MIIPTRTGPKSMKTTPDQTHVQVAKASRTTRARKSGAARAAALIVSGLLATSWPAMAQVAPPLPSSTLLGATTITDTGATPGSIYGNVDLYPGTSITGILPVDVTGTININNPAAKTAQGVASAAYNTLANGEPVATNESGKDLGTLTLAPGVYQFNSSAQLTGTLKLNNAGNQAGVYVFQIASTLTTATGSSVVLLGGSDPNIFWQVGTSATLGSATVFVGNIVASTSITLDPGATLSVGTASALNGAVTMAGGNTVNLNGPGSPAAPSSLLPAGANYWDGVEVPVVGATATTANWSDSNWTADPTGTTAPTTLAAGADVVFSVTGPGPATYYPPQHETTVLDVPETISSLTVNDPVAVTIGNPISGAKLLTINGSSGKASGITINPGAGLTTINSNVAFTTLAAQTITVNNTAGLVINGIVSGSSALTKGGVNTLILTGANTYAGGTTISAGALAVGDPTGLLHSSTALGTGSVTNGAALAALGSTLETTASTGGSTEKINVTGAYTQNATGNLLLQVVSSPAPTPSMSSGTAGTNYDTLAATGAASLGGTLFLNFNAPSVPSQGQRYTVVTSAAGPVTGQFTNNTTDTTGLPASFFPVTTYNDNFGNPALNNSVIITLILPFTSANFPGLTGNQNNVGTGVTNTLVTLNNAGLLGTSTGLGADFFNNIVTGLNLASYSGTLGAALDQLSPQRFEILHNVAFDNYALDVQNLDDELARERTGTGGIDTSGFVFNDSRLGPELSQIKGRLLAWSPAPEPGLLSDSTQAVLGGVQMFDDKEIKKMAHQESVNQWNTFIDGGVDLGQLDHNADASHASYTTGRVRAGADYRVSTDIRVGALFGYSHTDADLDNEGSKAHVDSYTPGLYAAYADKEGFYANGLFTYSRNDYTTDRNIIIPGVNRTATGSPSGNQFGGDADGGYEFHKGNWTFGPNAGLTYVNLGIDSFNESGAGAADLNVNNQSADSLRSRLGGTVRYQGKIGSVILTPHLSAFWQHEFLDNAANITSSFAGLPGGTFSVRTTRGDRDNALLGFGVDAELNKTITLFVDYKAEAGGSTFFGQSATGGVKVGF